MPAKRFTVEQIVAKLRGAERLQRQGMTVWQSPNDAFTRTARGPSFGPGA